MQKTNEKLVSLVNRGKAFAFVFTFKRRLKLLQGSTIKFTGCRTILWVKIQSNQSFDLTFEIIEGNAALYLVQKQTVYHLASQTGSAIKSITSDKGWARLRLVGERAKIRLSLTLLDPS